MPILLGADWKKYPNAIIHHETKNRSFVRLASIYRAMGIKNHAFILALHNPELKDVDPHSPTLTVEQMGMISLEVAENPWYALREVLRAPAIAGGDSTPVDAHRGIIALWWCFFCHIMIILIQPRQTGKSFGTDALMATLLNVTCQNTQINLLTKDDDLRRKNIQRVKDIIFDLPPYLKMMGKSDASNGEEITVKALGNSYNTHVPQASKKNALKMGRGLTSPIFHVDEPPFQSNIATALPAALAAGGAAIDKAKASGSPYGTILTTTAGKRDDSDGKYVYKLLMESAPWTERFFDAESMEQLYAMVRGSSRGERGGVLRIAAVFSHRMLGKTDEWLRQKLEESLQVGEDANRDYFNLWTAGNDLNPIPLPILEEISASVQEPSHIEISPINSYITRWFIPEHEVESFMANNKTIIGMDTSEASGGDDISLYVLDIKSGKTIGAGTYNETNLIMLSEWFCDMLTRYKNTTAIIERRSTGGMLLDYLLLMLPARGIDPFARLFNWVVNNMDEGPAEKERYMEINKPFARRPPDIYVRFKKYFGFATSGSGATSRSELYSTTLQLAAKRTCRKIFDKILVDQITGLITKNGRVDHEDGSHDDMVIAWLLTHWLITQGKNLQFYGIDAREILSTASITKQMTSSDFRQMHEQQQIRRRIEKIYEELTSNTDEFVISRLEHELRVLDKKIILQAEEVFSVDELIRSTKEARRNRRFKR